LTADPYQTAVLQAAKYFRRGVLNYFFNTFDEAKKTAILLPGGAGSALYRANRSFDRDSGPSDYTFNPVWLTPGIFVDDGNKLPISKNGRDLREQMIAADGDVQYFAKPYLKAMRVFRANLNALLLGWDWRRDIMTAVDMVSGVISEIERRKGKGTLKNIFLVGHSMGGMIAKLFFSTRQSVAREIGGMITVSTPFYGYLGQLRRIYEGEEILNDVYTAKRVAEIYSSFAGLYSLFPIDHDTYLKDGMALGLASYPVTEPKGGEYADPYQKRTSPPYPKWVRLNELPNALGLRRELAKPLPDNLGQKVFHIRALMHKTTPVAAEWDQNLSVPYEPPHSPSPIKIGPENLGQGDEVIPHWSARLASTPDRNVHDFASGEGEHMTLMAQDYVLRRILEIVTGKSVLTKDEFIAEYGPNPQMATREELKIFMQTHLPKIRLAFPSLEREIETLIPEKYFWRMLQDFAM
jgi:pimeloyl-ACP methyl ester carboxylesterase